MDSGSNSVMGMLWSITDRDIDRFTLRLYCDWFSAKSNSSKESGPCLSRFINESAIGKSFLPFNSNLVLSL
jgi:hypothetical protein